MIDNSLVTTKQLLQGEHEVIKNRVFGMPLTKMTRHQRVAFTAMIKIAYDTIVENNDVTTFTYSTNDFFEMMGISTKRKGSHLFSDLNTWGEDSVEYSLESTLRKLLNKTIIMRHKSTEDKMYAVEETVLVSYFKITKEEIKFEFSSWVRERILAVNNVYIMKLPIIASFVSGYTVTLFEQLEQRRDFRKWNTNIEDLRKIYGLEEEKYKNFSDFRKYVIEKGVTEINKKSNYVLTYEFTKKGRRIDKIIFTWHLIKDDDPYTQWKTFIRTTFIDTPLIRSTLGGGSVFHTIQVNKKGLLYNLHNKDCVYSKNEAQTIWKFMYDNQERMIIKGKTKGELKVEKEEDLTEAKDYSKFLGKDYIFDDEVYTDILTIHPVKDKLKIKFYHGDIIILSEVELEAGVVF